MNIKLWNLINDENDMPKLHIIKEMEYEPNGPELIHPYETILLWNDYIERKLILVGIILLF